MSIPNTRPMLPRPCRNGSRTAKLFRKSGGIEEVFENMYPQIVPREIFDRVRSKINANKYGKRSVEVVYLLRHKLKCGYCGQPISAETGTSKTGAKKRYYKCFGRKNHNGCQKSMMRKDQLENLVVSTIIDELSKPKTLDQIVAGLLEEQERYIKEHSMLNVLLREQRQVEASIENVMAAIERGVITNTTTKRLKELEARQEELDRQILIERSKNVVRVSAEEIKMYYKEALALEEQMLIKYIVKEIVMYDDKIEIFFNKPTRNSPDESRGCFVYKGRKENFDGRYGSCETSRIDDFEGVQRHLEAPISLTGIGQKRRT